MRRYYDEHAAELRTEVRVWRIMRRSEEAIGEALAAGEAFEKVALADMPPLPEGATAPYDMGWLNLMQIPQSWSEAVVALRPGQVSDVLRGDGARFWIIKLMDRRDNPGVTFEASRAALGQRLAVGSRERQRDALVQALRRAARIEYRPYGTRGGGRE